MIDIERLAREADPDYGNDDGLLSDSLCGRNAIERFAALVRNEVLEEAAAFVEVQRNDIPARGFEFAAAIRALKDKT